MKPDETALVRRAMELRRAFDRSFAEAPGGERTPTEGFLAVGVGNESYALRMTEITGLYVDKKVTPLPSMSTDLLGLSGFRGALVPVYDLRSLLGYAATGSIPRWLVLIAPQTPVGLAFERFDGYLDSPRGDMVQERRPAMARPHAGEILRSGDTLRTIIHLPSVLALLTNRVSQSPMQEE